VAAPVYGATVAAALGTLAVAEEAVAVVAAAEGMLIVDANAIVSGA